MTWFTYLIGLVVFAIGAASRFFFLLLEWQALLPLVFGLGYVTLGEGMRSKPAWKRLFLFLGILWSVVVIIAMLPVAREGWAVWNNEQPAPDQRMMRSELVMEHAGTLLVSAAYLLVAVIVFFRRPATTTPPSPGNQTLADR